MISVEQAVARITGAFTPLEAETVSLDKAAGRVLAADAVARFDQPPYAVSAMDGYAVRAADAATVPVELSVIGEAPAGSPFGGRVGPDQAVRIFTGGVVPKGADAVVIQEDTEPVGEKIRVKEAPRAVENVRVAGLDFKVGETVVAKGRRLSARDLVLIAAADLPALAVTRKPRVAVVATGDELSRPGAPRQPGGIVASSVYGLVAMTNAWGGEGIDHGILPDKLEAFARLPEACKDADLIVTLGGASVGDHDLVQRALTPHGFALDFWKIAMRPGKPLIFGRLKDTPLLGLPGNPVSALVCAILFLRPVLAAMLGASFAPAIVAATLASALKANGPRQDYIRTRIQTEGSQRIAEPFALQDSSMQRIFAEADGLIVRPPGASAATAGETVDVLLLESC